MRNLSGVKLVAFLCLAAVLLVQGCSREPIGSHDDIAVVKYRYILDGTTGIARVVGEVRNTGDLQTPEAEIIATLRSRTGSMKGHNRVAIPRIGVGESREFALAVTSHGSVNSIELTIVEPGAIAPDGDEDVPEDGEVNGEDEGQEGDGDGE